MNLKVQIRCHYKNTTQNTHLTQTRDWYKSDAMTLSTAKRCLRATFVNNDEMNIHVTVIVSLTLYSRVFGHSRGRKAKGS